jgi:hypothetical protein
MTAGTQTYIQSIPLVAGAAVPQANSTLCMVVANDALWPTGTGYDVALTDTHGNSLPGYPMQWQLMGPGTTINLSSKLPYYHGIVMFPQPRFWRSGKPQVFQGERKEMKPPEIAAVCCVDLGDEELVKSLWGFFRLMLGKQAERRQRHIVPCALERRLNNRWLWLNAK